LRRVLLFLSPLVAAGAIWLAVSAFVSTAPGGDLLGRGSQPAAAEPETLIYSAKFVCGTVTESQFLDGAPVVPGTYQTAVNVHNPSLTSSVTMEKWVSVALPGETVGPIAILAMEYVLGPNYAFEIDCNEIQAKLAAGGHTYTFVKGFVVIADFAGGPLDVTAVYTTQYVNAVVGKEGLGQAIDIEPVPSRVYQSGEPPVAPSNVYSAKFVCGTSAGPDPVVAGDYRSAINVYNPNGFNVFLRKKVVLAEREPAAGGEFGDISGWRYEVIPSSGAFEIDCDDIRSFFEGVPSFIKGFVVIETMDEPSGVAFNGELDVVPVHTVRRMTAYPNNGYGTDIDVLRVDKKTKSAPPAGTPTPTPTSTRTPLVTNTPTRTPTPTNTPTRTPTPTNTPTRTPTPTNTPTRTPTTIPKTELTQYFQYCYHSITPSGGNTKVHVGCVMTAQAPLPAIYDWEVIYADQSPVMNGPAVIPPDWTCSEDNATDWWPDTNWVLTRVKCEDPTHGSPPPGRPWKVNECRDIDFILPGAQGGWNTLMLHATDQNQNNLGIFFSVLGTPPC
jgi:hypothetical protein